MESVEFRLRVPDQPELDSQTRLALLDEGTLTDMPSDMAQDLLQRDDIGIFVFSAMLEDTGVFMTEDWVVRIVGDKLIDCVYALCALISLIAEFFDTPVSVDLRTLRNRNENPLYRLLASRSLLARLKSGLWWLLAAAISGAIGAWLGATVFGG